MSDCSNNIVSKPILHLVVALSAEARPWIVQYRLQQLVGSTAFPVYVNAERSIYLIVSGIGKVNAAAATTYLYQLSGAAANGIFCNVGVAGADYPLGTVGLVGKIVDAASDHVFYPGLQRMHPLCICTLQTVDKPQTQYIEDSWFDMEAAGFFAAARFCVAQEQIAVFKVVSDNTEHGTDKVTKAQAIDYITAAIPAIDDYLWLMLKLMSAPDLMPPATPAFDVLCQQGHFTQYQRHQLKALLKRWAICLPQRDVLEHIGEVKAAAKVLQFLEQYLLAAASEGF
jgi:hypothetical protein